MIRVVSLVTLFLVLASCGPIPVYHKAGIPLANLRDDQVACKVSALRDAPVAMRTRQEPPRYVPPRRICRTPESCYTEPGFWLPGQVTSVDVNLGLRTELEGRCMAGRGYSQASLPRCPASMEAQMAPQVLPELGPKSCVRQDGPLQTILIRP